MAARAKKCLFSNHSVRTLCETYSRNHHWKKMERSRVRIVCVLYSFQCSENFSRFSNSRKTAFFKLQNIQLIFLAVPAHLNSKPIMSEIFRNSLHFIKYMQYSPTKGGIHKLCRQDFVNFWPPRLCRYIQIIPKYLYHI